MVYAALDLAMQNHDTGGQKDNTNDGKCNTEWGGTISR